jgi:4-amino-4-deoxy-L-arabinose transferase-like glycosyltransferase
LKLGIAKGFLNMAYFAIYRKTFSPFSTLDLYKARFGASPWEFSLLLAGAAAAFLLWRRFTDRAALLPWCAFTVVFLLATLKVTLPYTYYYAPVVAVLAVLSGAAFGMLWELLRPPWRYALPLAVVISIVGGTLQFRAVAIHENSLNPYQIAVLRLLRQNPVGAGQRFYIPFQLLPTLHYYFPDVETLGYDFDFPLPKLVDGLNSGSAAKMMLCEEQMCTAIESRWAGFAAQKELLASTGPSGQPLFVVRTGRRGGPSLR